MALTLLILRVCLHREAMDFFRVKTMLWKNIYIFLPIFIILSDIEESTIELSHFQRAKMT